MIILRSSIWILWSDTLAPGNTVHPYSYTSMVTTCQELVLSSQLKTTPRIGPGRIAMQNRMLFKLFLLPIALLLGSIVSMFVLGNLLPSHFEAIPMFSKLSEQSLNSAPWVGALLLLGSIVFFWISFARLWNWQKGSAASCSECGGMVDQKLGRYGRYLHCLACGKNESI